MKTIQELFQTSKYKPDFVGPIPESEIKVFEDNRGIVTPPPYRDFLRDFGCGNIGPFEIYGLGIKPIGVPSLPWLLNRFETTGIQVPKEILPFHDIGDGHYACIVCKPFQRFQTGDILLFDGTSDLINQRWELLSKGFHEYIAQHVHA